MAAYYNENDPRAAAWLRELIKEGLIADGEVDERSICDVRATDLTGFRQCHFFAGIGGWSLALRLAGWDDERAVWTGSCPCQPFSSATRGRARTGDDIDLWPTWFKLIASSRPRIVFGEEAPHKGWIDRTSDDMESVGYRVGAAVLPACSVGADHARHRLFFVCDTDSDGEPSVPKHGKASGVPRVERDAKPIPAEDGLPGRVGLLRSYGNAIVPQVAAAFIEAYMSVRGD